MRGISPIVAVVLLLAMAVISGVGVYFWVNTFTSKPATPNGPIIIQATPIGDGKVLITNLGQKTASLSNLKPGSRDVRLSCIDTDVTPGGQELCVIEGYPKTEEVVITGNGVSPIILKRSSVFPQKPETWFNYYSIGTASSGQNLFVYNSKLILTIDVNTSQYFSPGVVILNPKTGEILNVTYYYINQNTELNNGARSSVITDNTLVMAVYNDTHVGVISVNLSNLEPECGVITKVDGEYKIYDLLKSEDGGYILAGGNGTDGLVVKISGLSDSPKVDWAINLDDMYTLMGITEVETGYIITGTVYGSNKNVTAIKLNKSTGNIIIKKEYDSGGYDIGRWVTEDMEGLIIAGILQGYAGELNIDENLHLKGAKAYSLQDRGLTLKYVIPIKTGGYMAVGESSNSTNTWTYTGLLDSNLNTVWGRLYGESCSERNWIGPLIQNGNYYTLIGTYKSPEGGIYLDAIQIDNLGRLNCIDLFRDANVSDIPVDVNVSDAPITETHLNLNAQSVSVHVGTIEFTTIKRCEY